MDRLHLERGWQCVLLTSVLQSFRIFAPREDFLPFVPQCLRAFVPWVAGAARAVLISAAYAAEAQSAKQRLQFEVKDVQGQALPCRIHVTDSVEKPQQALGLPFWRDHFVCDGRATLQVSLGRYQYQIERGPEYKPVSGSVEVPISQDQSVSIRLNRIADLAKEEWFAGDLHVHRPLKDMALLMQAEDLHIAPVSRQD